MPVTATPVPILSDNYAWLLRDSATGATAIVDPAEAAPCIAAIEKAGGKLDLVLLTHHHGDHIAEADKVQARFGARMVGAAADAHRLPKLDQAVKEGDTVKLGNASAQIIETPGHTVGQINYFFPDGAILCSGDTLFSLGCGRIIEGNAPMMYASLQKLAALPDETLVCCGHEYTVSNGKFALHVEPGNKALQARMAEVNAQRAAGKPSVPSTMGSEKAANPFLTAKDEAEFAARRKAKDSF
jgi:hydroxyacylglutathione hydrolase